MIHLFEFREDNAKILFVDSWATIFVRGAMRVITMIKVIIVIRLLLILMLITSIVGNTFCQVITINMEFCFICIELISLMYHRWVGHLPILANRVMVSRRDEVLLSAKLVIINIEIDMIVCRR